MKIYDSDAQISSVLLLVNYLIFALIVSCFAFLFFSTRCKFHVDYLTVTQNLRLCFVFDLID